MTRAADPLSAETFGSASAGNVAVVGGHYADGAGFSADACVCATMFWMFLPCWIGLKNQAGGKSVHGSLVFHRRDNTGLGRVRLGPIDISLASLDDGIEHPSPKRRFAAESNVGDSADGSGSWNRRQRHQLGCFCGMPTKDAAGNFCTNAFDRPKFMERLHVADRTLALIKPDAVQHRSHIVKLIVEHGFTIVKERVVHLTPAEAGEFYLQNVNKRSYQALKSYISSGPVVVLVLARENAVHFWRQVIGDKTDAFKSDNQTLRSLFGRDMLHTGLHGSDSYLSAECEIRFFFPEVTFNPLIINSGSFGAGDVTPVVATKLANNCLVHPRYPTLLTYD